MFCKSCGKEVSEQAVVCVSCGVALPAKSKIAAGILGIFLGYLGVHRFYLGYVVIGAVQLGLTVLGAATSCLFVGWFLLAGSAIWGFVEGILILVGTLSRDAEGRPLRD